MHLQIEPEDFVASYNWAQAISAPILAVSTNSPMLLGRELWDETRIALFRQSVDTRISGRALRDREPRVTFGRSWVKDSIMEIYKEDISRFPPLISIDITEDSHVALENGQAPKLKALATNNSTVYRWNRPCYGVNGGIPHMRIENRYIPSGPTTEDEIANMALWVGVMLGRPEKWDSASEMMDFNDVRRNFLKAARTGINSQFIWEGREISAQELILNEFIPLAEAGLKKAGVESSDIERYLGIIRRRTHSHTGSQWTVKSFRNLRKTHKNGEARVKLTEAMYANTKSGQTIDSWKVIEPVQKEGGLFRLPVWQVMTSSLITAKSHDPATLVSSVMRWMNIHHMPVENEKGEIIGLLTLSHMDKYYETKTSEAVTVEEIMIKNVRTIDPELSVEEAMKLMKEERIGCLPVVNANGLVGLITAHDMEEQAYGKSV
ncbi:MAG: CBS domain-containing protein [Flavobacteriales bacterium]|nr:CBS domain-containing protein [Flavobacteriales bacterium]